MTSRDCSSSWFSWWSVALLFWGTSTVGSLVNEESDNSLTTPGDYFIKVAANNTNESSHGESYAMPDCGKKTPKCEIFCDTCFDIEQMLCLSLLIGQVCTIPFQAQMDLHNSTDWCVWSNVGSAYNNFTICTEEIAECLLIPWPNPMVEDMFLKIHATYFHACPSEELSDPPPGIVFALVMTPICLIPVMVMLVVLKTKDGDRSS